jgi:DNA-binding transcriptional LysR family regulator
MDWADRIGRRLKLRDLHFLLTVVQCRSMSKAAGHLAVSTPVVSKAIADLEHAVGVRLLDRSPQGVEPTIYGRALLDGGLGAFDALNQAVKQLEFLADPRAGDVRIGCSVAIGTSFVPAVIDKLCRRHPRIIFQVLAGESSMAYRALAERSVDLAIVRVFGPIAGERLHAEIVYDEPDIVVVGAGSRWARRRSIRLAELMNEPWTLPPPDSLSGSVVLEAFRANGLDVPRATVITSTIPVRNALLATGRFLSIIPAYALKFPKNQAIKVLPVDLPVRSPVGIITLKNRTISPVAQLFIDCAREVAKPLAKAR